MSRTETSEAVAVRLVPRAGRVVSQVESHFARGFWSCTVGVVTGALRCTLAVVALQLLCGCIVACPLKAAQVDTVEETKTADIEIPETENFDPGFCIIRPDEPASAEIYVDHNGQRVYFCCESCRRDFLSDPGRFDGVLQASAEDSDLGQWNAAADPYAHTFWGRVGRIVLVLTSAVQWVATTFHLDDPISRVLAIASAIFIGWVAVGWFRSWRFGHAVWPRGAVVISAILFLVPCFYADKLRHQLALANRELGESEEGRLLAEGRNRDLVDKDSLHYATFLNFGDPPIPRPSQSARSLQKTYFRGNDERSDEMAYGGNYRTVTFQLWIEDAEGRVVNVGSRLEGPDGEPADLFLVVKFIRAPDTSSGYFTETYMKRMYVTMESGDFLGRDEPVADRIEWQMTKQEQEWTARYQLPDEVLVWEKTEDDFHPQWIHRADVDRPFDRGGVVYLCEDRYERDRMIGGRFHYAIRYELETVEGVVTDRSDLWMQATYRGRNFAELQIEDTEWLSDEPIPEK